MLIAFAALAWQDAGVIVDRNRIDRTPAPREAPARSTPKRGSARVTAVGSEVPIQGIAFKGAQAPAAVAEAARRFIGRPGNKDTLLELAGTLSRAYQRTDVALYTVAIPEQDTSGGTVTVLLTEGRIATAAVKSDAKSDRRGNRLLRARMAPMLDETPLSRGTFERQVTLMRAIPGLSFTTDFADPNATGALALTVTPKQKRTRFSAGFSNRGVAQLGDGQFDAKAEFYGLGIDGDQLTLSASAASDLKRYRYLSGAYAVPITASGLTLTTSGGYLETRPRGYPVLGKAKLAGTSLSYPLIRSFHRSADLSLGVDGLNSDNAAFGALIATERTRALRGGASFADTRDKRSVAFGLSASQGLDILGARTDPLYADPRFLKLNGSAYLAQAIGKRFVARLQGGGQWSRDRLPAAERFAVGGDTYGRAFDVGFLSGDRGAGALGEFAVRPIKGKKFGTSEIYTFVDRAWIGIEGRGGMTVRGDYALASAGFGTRLRWVDKAELGLEASRVIDTPYPGYDDDWRFALAWRLSL
ncbi:ShlB/FhaC/HecB family hemolysin secretion/activation protein [Sphingomonas sp. HITSZ_GF]|uniref:ShlB/FhaC/HecB family hemolysin secretion/activation protein n=1 Tax=Sphingomonas sp. HITSZ_GF TaxID=3037247 RepID=UPI00240D136A|nr:ShlB/FhaC/HecB family hemolysin secretion/activation protein [Sphingomonas sp. HITSZ_GF]MDG2533197.1 ShlB/FhaC/HecB family hemolysin secretion/activation protein [Sphingomonas sp. HITSZ_GF]